MKWYLLRSRRPVPGVERGPFTDLVGTSAQNLRRRPCDVVR
jgi:hypothetical protein